MSSKTNVSPRYCPSRLSLAMLHAGVSASGLAERCGLSPQTVLRAIHGQTQRPETWARLAAELGVDLGSLIAVDDGGAP